MGISLKCQLCTLLRMVNYSHEGTAMVYYERVFILLVITCLNITLLMLIKGQDFVTTSTLYCFMYYLYKYSIRMGVMRKQLHIICWLTNKSEEVLI